MFDRIGRKQLSLRMAMDFSVITTAWVASYFIRFYGIIPVDKGIPPFIMFIKLLPFILISWTITFQFLGLYKKGAVRAQPLLESLSLVKASFASLILFVAMTYFYHEFIHSRATILIFALLQPGFLIVGRSIVREAVRFRRRKNQPIRVLCIGTEATIVKAEHLCEASVFDCRFTVDAMIVGESTDRQTALVIPDSWGEFFSEHHYTGVVIALPFEQFSFLDHHLADITNQITNIHILPSFPGTDRLNLCPHQINQTLVISVNDAPISDFSRVIKRFIDIFGAIVALLIFSPIMAICAILIALISPGAILYRQKRMGLDGNVFEMLKFRSMSESSEQSTGAVWATQGDHRVTSIGSFLRRTSLDELPQLLNVLRGEMSLVGPRPERPVFVNQFRTEVPGYMQRHRVKSGITGWAQVNGWRGNTSIERRIQYDLEYIRNWSIWLDFKILLLTFLKGFVHPNAY